MPILFTDNSNMFIDHNIGSIGIGTSSSTSNLHVVGQTFLNGNLTVSGFTSISNISFSSSVSLTGLTVTGTGITGTLNTATQGGITSVGTLTGLTVSGTGITGILNTGTQTNITSIGRLSNLIVNNGINIPITGYVGIGITRPESNLHIQGNTRILSTTGLTGMYVTTLGNVGIGTSVPTGNLHVLGTTQILGRSGTTGLYVSNVGNVGIGSSNPQYNLDIIGTMRCSNVSIFQGPSATSSTFGATLGMEGQHCVLQLNANVGNDTYIDFSSTGSDYLGRIMYSSTANVMLFNTRLSERMRIDSTGNVSIGVTSTTHKLDVGGNANITGAIYSASKQVSTITTFSVVFNAPSSTGIGTTSVSVPSFSYVGFITATVSNGDLNANAGVYFIGATPVYNGVSPTGIVNQVYLIMNVITGGSFPVRCNICFSYYPI